MHKKKGSPCIPLILLYRNSRAGIVYPHCQREKISVTKKSLKVGKQLSPIPARLWGQIQSTSCKLAGVLLWQIQWLWCIQSRFQQQFHVQTINIKNIRAVAFVQPRYVNTLKCPSQGKSEASPYCIFAKDWGVLPQMCCAGAKISSS